MKLQRAKGTRDFNPEEKIQRNKVVDTLRQVFESYGFNPLETPIIERLDVLSAKYAGGDEILKEMFKLSDQGKRELVLRYDLTVPFSRFVGMNPTMKTPFKRYQIGRVFRDGPIKLGRYREFWQCDVDIMGCNKMTSEAELLRLTLDAFEKLGLDINVNINNRKLLDGILDALQVKNKIEIILTIDKLKKIPRKDLIAELKEKGMKDKDIKILLGVFETKGSNEEKIKIVEGLIRTDEGKLGLEEIKELLSYIKNEKIVLNISLARGLAYYTGTVFEVFLNDSEFKSSLAGGGRYDKMIPDFLDTKKEFPAVGISFGLEPITEMIKLRTKDNKKTVTKAFIIPIKNFKNCLPIADEIRNKKVNVEIDIMNRGISKNLTYINTMNIPFAIIIGEDELKQKKVKLKDMNSGEESLVSVEEAIELLINKDN